ncbi:hypothetical protein Tco_0653115 [Tanacetum coccineum]|uniref:Uncharacterized protein n=1 Tax=Tanacetum coccineum TaxID=301880 RepID=A0ABQ4WZF8_9ASTR
MVWSGYAVLMFGKTDSIKLNNIPGCLPRSTFLYNEVFKLDFSSASLHLMHANVPALKRHSSTLLANSNKGMPHGLKEAQEKRGFTLLALLEKAQGVTIIDCHAGNSCVHICDPTVKTNDPIIEGIQGM